MMSANYFIRFQGHFFKLRLTRDMSGYISVMYVTDDNKLECCVCGDCYCGTLCRRICFRS